MGCMGSWVGDVEFVRDNFLPQRHEGRSQRMPRAEKICLSGTFTTARIFYKLPGAFQNKSPCRHGCRCSLYCYLKTDRYKYWRRLNVYLPLCSHVQSFTIVHSIACVPFCACSFFSSSSVWAINYFRKKGHCMEIMVSGAEVMQMTVSHSFS